MNRQITFEQYRSIDLTILAVVLGFCQFMIHMASTLWFPDQLYVVSPVAAMTALVMMRWNGWAAVHAAIGGVLYAVLAGGDFKQILIYGAGNLLGLGAMVMFKYPGKERIRKDALMAMIFGLLTQILMQLGRAAVALVFGYPAEALLGFITTDILSGLFTLVIVWIVRRIEGLFEDQKNYLLRIQREQKVERGEQF